jgi:hypothetical protein
VVYTKLLKSLVKDFEVVDVYVVKKMRKTETI